MELPKFENITLNKYLDKLEEYKFSLNTDKYNIILSFINSVFNKKLKSLTDFKDFNLNKETKYNKVIEKYNNDYFQKYFLLKFSTNRYDNEYLIFTLRKLLTSLGYKLVKNKQNLFTIKL